MPRPSAGASVFLPGAVPIFAALHLHVAPIHPMASPSRSDALLGIVQLLRPLNFVLFLAGVALGGVLGGR